MNAPAPRVGIPLRPDHRAVEREWRRSFNHYATAEVLGELRKTAPDAILRETWSGDRTAELILRSPVEVMKQDPLPGESIVKLMQLAPESPVAKFSALVTKVNTRGTSQFSMVSPANVTAAKFIREGMQIPVVQLSFEGFPVGPVKKLALISALSGELETATNGIANAVIGRTLEIAIGDGAAEIMFSADAQTDEAPAGLLFGVAPVTGSADAAKDLKALRSAIASGGIDTSSLVYIMASDQAGSMETMPWPNFRSPVIEAKTLDAGTVIAIAADAVLMAGEGIPRIDTRKQTTLQMANPASPISAPGSPNVINAPVVSTSQADQIALRCVARLTWAAAPGSVAWIQGATW